MHPRCLHALTAGGFIASAGLESYYSHGFMTAGANGGAVHSAVQNSTLAFVRASLENFVSSTLPYVHVGYKLAEEGIDAPGADLAGTLHTLAVLDWRYHTLVLNHVARRASTIQGMAILSLYSRSFAAPLTSPGSERSARASELIAALRAAIRRGGAQLGSGALSLQDNAMAGHLCVCAGVFSAAAGLSLDRALRLQLFLQARNLMSCSIRLNTLGPYVAHQLLMFELRAMVHELLTKYSTRAGHALCTQARARATALASPEASSNSVAASASAPPETPTPAPAPPSPAPSSWDWDWDDDEPAAPLDMPATCWPLGEIVQARHDQLHSRLFNS